MFKRLLLLSLFSLSACSSHAQPTVMAWPEFSCSDNAVVITFVDLNVCTKASTYSKVEVLAGATPTIVFEQNGTDFNALSYEPAEKALSGLPSRIQAESPRQALDALFSWRDSSNLSPKQQAFLQVFGIEAQTQLMQFTNGNMTAYVRLNEGAADNTIFMIVGNSSNVYRVIGNFSSADVQQWLSLLNVN
ncbi:hypothetical protein [Rheinheimera aquimaris]|jgi:hypothetical protein|uniref:hypothetical protein n=1 Tax=Rheinheimera aquimaris TaxID=412437 RepID=UPI0010663025|nr:hypothetical protein [Rheinheimera aquimaris]|tara:strand:- start:4872 stop:5441 length:570 start_codon:yes stop_codon:yes gene_type:complete